MLDDANLIRQRDSQDFLGFIAHQPAQLAYDFGICGQSFGREFAHVVFAGMGGSALAAEFVRSYPELKVPFVIVKGYDLPAFVGEDTLVICASYSGNTEETISVFDQAEAKKVCLAVIAHAGQLAQRARDHYMFAQIPECPQPRASALYMYRALLEILVAARLIETAVIDQVEGTMTFLQASISGWVVSVPEEQNLAKELAERCMGKTPIIYAGPLMAPAAYNWKISFNENAKNTAWCNYFSEFNHNEFIGWSSHPIEKPFAVIDLLSSLEHPRIQKRFVITDRLLSGKRPKSIAVQAVGDSVVAQVLYLTLLGDFVSTYVAFLNGVNPAPVELVEKFKTELNK